ncbi:MAG: phosphatidylglycerophosphate synthase, partial [Corynebacterium urealyticum]
MLSEHARRPASVIIEPIARTLQKAHVSPN